MIAFRILVNGVTVCTAAVGKKGVLSAIISHVDGRSGIGEEPPTASLHVGGLKGSQHMEWLGGHRELNIGDTVQLEVI